MQSTLLSCNTLLILPRLRILSEAFLSRLNKQEVPCCPVSIDGRIGQRSQVYPERRSITNRLTKGSLTSFPDGLIEVDQSMTDEHTDSVALLLKQGQSELCS